MSDTPRTDNFFSQTITMNTCDSLAGWLALSTALETELTHALAAANIQAGVFEQTVAENQELRQQIDDLTKELEMERSKNRKRPHRQNVTLEIRKCAERIAEIGDTCACGRPYTTKHYGCSDRLYFVCEPCGKEILIG